MTSTARRRARQVGSMQLQIPRDGWAAARACRPDLIAHHLKIMGAPDMAQALGAPAVLAPPVPMVQPTAARPCPAPVCRRPRPLSSTAPAIVGSQGGKRQRPKPQAANSTSLIVELRVGDSLRGRGTRIDASRGHPAKSAPVPPCRRCRHRDGHGAARRANGRLRVVAPNPLQRDRHSASSRLRDARGRAVPAVSGLVHRLFEPAQSRGGNHEAGRAAPRSAIHGTPGCIASTARSMKLRTFGVR